MCVYITTNSRHTVLYVGVTNNLKKRVYQHKKKALKGFTNKYNIDKLVYFELYEDAITAIKREKTLKNLLRRKKIALINSFNPLWKDLADEILSA